MTVAGELFVLNVSDKRKPAKIAGISLWLYTGMSRRFLVFSL